jgi:hypothetical protein
MKLKPLINNLRRIVQCDLENLKAPNQPKTVFKAGEK